MKRPEKKSGRDKTTGKAETACETINAASAAQRLWFVAKLGQTRIVPGFYTFGYPKDDGGMLETHCVGALRPALTGARRGRQKSETTFTPARAKLRAKLG